MAARALARCGTSTAGWRCAAVDTNSVRRPVPARGSGSGGLAAGAGATKQTMPVRCSAGGGGAELDLDLDEDSVVAEVEPPAGEFEADRPDGMPRMPPSDIQLQSPRQWSPIAYAFLGDAVWAGAHTLKNTSTHVLCSPPQALPSLMYECCADN
jgi:hypothetical protein